MKEEEIASGHRQKKREAEEAYKVEVVPGVTVASLRRFRAALIGRSVVNATRLGAWLRSGEGIEWLAAGIIPNSLSNALLLSFSGMCILLLFFSFCRFCFVSFLFLLCSRWSFVDVPLIFFCPADHVPDWQPRILLGSVEARSVNVKKRLIMPT